MYVLFEEGGAFKAGHVMAETEASLQIELASGKRAKVKRAHVLLTFTAPGPEALIESAGALAQDIDVAFLWECCSEGVEFGYEELAADYFGRVPSSVELAAILFRVFEAPVYFHRKGKGRFRAAPGDILRAALAGLEKKAQQAAHIEGMTKALLAGDLPEDVAAHLDELLYKPDRNKPECKALEAACTESGVSVPHLLARCGAIRSAHDYLFRRFLREFFPQGTGFPADAVFTVPEDLPLAEVEAFSIDDAQTTEIDDAFSLVRLHNGNLQIGIHIAAPGLGFGPESVLGGVGRNRLSTVYMPGRKITMLPDDVVEAFTLAEGCVCPALSLYLEVGPDYALRRQESRIERVRIAANLRHHDLEPVFNEKTLALPAEARPDFPYRNELTTLWEYASICEAARGKSASGQQRKDYSFAVDWFDTPATAADDAFPPEGHVTISERPRGSPLDKLVAELMIVANSTWGGLLAEHGVPGIYRAQSLGKVRMTTVAAPHQGLGVDQYAWSSSPLRRYCDLVNQWQLIAALRGENAPFAPKSAELFATLRDFDVTYNAYAEMQRQMERYWCLRWLVQERVMAPQATVVRDELVRVDHLPLMLRVPSLPPLPPGSRVALTVDKIDFLDVLCEARYNGTLSEAESVLGDADNGV